MSDFHSLPPKQNKKPKQNQDLNKLKYPEYGFVDIGK